MVIIDEAKLYSYRRHMYPYKCIIRNLFVRYFKRDNYVNCYYSAVTQMSNLTTLCEMEKMSLYDSDLLKSYKYRI